MYAKVMDNTHIRSLGFLIVCMLGKQFKLEPVPEAAIAILIDYFREEIFTMGRQVHRFNLLIELRIPLKKD